MSVAFAQETPKAAMKVPHWMTLELAQVRFESEDPSNLTSLKKKKNCYKRKYWLFGKLVDKCNDLPPEPVSPDSIITGNDILKYMVAINPESMRVDTKPDQKLIDQSLVLAVISKILDREAVAAKLPTEVSNTRGWYAIRAILTQNAVQQGKIPTKINDEGKKVADIDVTKLLPAELDQMYGWLKDAVGENTVAFNMNWKYTGGQLLFYMNLLSQSEKLNWPKVKLSFDKLPATLAEFDTEVKKRLEPTNDALVKQAVWKRIVAMNTPSYAASLNGAANYTELTRLHAAVVDMVLEDMRRQGDKDPKFELSNPQVRELLDNKFLQTRQTMLAREAIYQLLKKNMIILMDFNTCGDQRYACLSTDEKQLTNSIFPESLFKGESLGYEPMSNEKRVSTLNHPQDYWKVLDISSDYLGLILR